MHLEVLEFDVGNGVGTLKNVVCLLKLVFIFYSPESQMTTFASTALTTACNTHFRIGQLEGKNFYEVVLKQYVKAFQADVEL